MADSSRREFLVLGAWLTGALGFRKRTASTVSQAMARPFEPDLILVNGRVLTQDDGLPRAEAFAVKDGRFLAVGSNADIRNLASPRTRVIDAGT